MQHLLKLPFGLLAACLLLAAGPAHAVKMPTVDICHFDADEGIYKKLSVSGKAVQPHLNHGDVLPGVDNEDPLPDLDDDCLASIVPDPIARAYIDVDQDGAYDATKDVDIAVVLDTDGTPGLSVGDTIELGQYPKDFNPCPDMTIASCDLGIFNNTPQAVTDVRPPNPPSFQYVVHSTELALSIGVGSIGENLEFGNHITSPSGDVLLIDIFAGASFDADTLEVTSDPAWIPSDVVPLAFDPGSGTTNGHYINVIIY